MNEVKLLTVAEAARRLGVSRATMYRLIETNFIPSVQLGSGQRRGKMIRIDEADIDRFVKLRSGGIAAYAPTTALDEAADIVNQAAARLEPAALGPGAEHAKLADLLRDTSAGLERLEQLRLRVRRRMRELEDEHPALLDATAE